MDEFFIHTARKIEAARRVTKQTSWLKELKTFAFWRDCLAELLGTFIFLFVGYQAIIGTAYVDPMLTNNATVILSAVCMGGGVWIAIQWVGHISGAHLNPVVTLAFVIMSTISPIKAVFYAILQLGGAVAAAGIVYATSDPQYRGDMAPTILGPNISIGQGIGIEIILTFALVSMILGTIDSRRVSFSGVALEIGLTVSVLIMSGVRVTGASMNPARSLGSAVFGGVWRDHWVFWLGPMVGSILAAVMYRFVLSPYKGSLTVEEILTKTPSMGSETNIESTKLSSSNNNISHIGLTNVNENTQNSGNTQDKSLPVYRMFKN